MKTVRRPNISIEGFKLIRELGVGGFASTYLFEDLQRELAEFVAVKVPHPGNKEFELALVSGDLRSLSALKGISNIVQLLDIRLVDDRYVLIMEYVDGPLLRDMLDQAESQTGLPVDVALRYTFQIAEALDAAHRRDKVHRDIKPDNIIIDKATDDAKILDFGIASTLNKKKKAKTQHRRYTPIYSPPEVLLRGEVSAQVDIYSLGVTLYEMITGRLPFDKSYHTIQPKILKPQLPIYIERAIVKAIQKDPDNRYPNMREFIEALQEPKEIKAAHNHISKGAMRRAEHILKAFIERSPDDPRGYAELAHLLNRCHRSEEAMQLLKKAIEIDALDGDLCFSLGATLIQLGKNAEAFGYLQKAKTMCDENKMRAKITSLINRCKPSSE
jgi:serine/threonine protein kinase